MPRNLPCLQQGGEGRKRAGVTSSRGQNPTANRPLFISVPILSFITQALRRMHQSSCDVLVTFISLHIPFPFLSYTFNPKVNSQCSSWHRRNRLASRTSFLPSSRRKNRIVREWRVWPRLTSKGTFPGPNLSIWFSDEKIRSMAHASQLGREADLPLIDILPCKRQTVYTRHPRIFLLSSLRERLVVSCGKFFATEEIDTVGATPEKEELLART